MSFRHMLRRAALLLATSGVPLQAAAATPFVELRGYPAGAIVSGGALFALDPRTEFGVFALYNRAERDDAGEHDDESGDGFGVGAELRRFHRNAPRGWFYGARAELFQLDIDWRDDAPARRGQSDVIVLQPTARLGYRFEDVMPGASLEIAAGLGAEINLATDGEDIGEGAIGLLGVALRFD